MRIRSSARAFVRNEKNEILLQKFAFVFAGAEKTLWLTPGGEIKEGESHKQALERELFEELGLRVRVEGERVLSLDVPIEGSAESLISREVYYMVSIPADTAFTLENMEDYEKESFRGLKWWSLDELKNTEEAFAPKEQILKLLTE